MKRILLVLIACLTPALARGQVIDLTTAGSTFFGADGVHWYQSTTFSGSTSFVEFLRLQGNPTEQGFNTDFRPFPENDVGTTATHSITFSVFQPRILTDATGAQRVFTLLLDVNELTSSGDNYLSLDSLTVYSVPQGSGGALGTRAAIAAVGTVRYDMDVPANQVVLLDGNLVQGSGGNDLEIDIPTSRFDGVGADDYIYVLMHLGKVATVGARKYGTSGGFEELRYYSQTVTDVEETSASTGPWIRMIGAPSGALRAHYYVPGAGQVRLTLYDVHGRVVASTSFREEAGGMGDLALHAVPSVSRLASGIYFYRFEWNETGRSGKLAILR